MKHNRHLANPRRQRGVGTLVVVMILFFVVSLVAAYTSRNLIFEQRSSANQYRSTQSLEAADAGLEWAMAMLNGGRIDANCRPSTDPANNTFRDRYLSSAGIDYSAIGPDGAITLRALTATPSQRPMPACVFDAATNRWSCNCPSDGAASLPVLSSTAAQPMFRVQFAPVGNPANPLSSSNRLDVVQIVSAGCTRPDPSCLAWTPSAPAGDAMTVVTAMVALKSGLTTPPAAPITAHGDISAGAGPLHVTNADPGTNGVTLYAGGTVTGSPGGSLDLASLPGTPGSASIVQLDPLLQSFPGADDMFAAVFGMTPTMYVQQPATVTMDCTAGCNSSVVNAQAANSPGRMLWVNGDLTIDADIGSAAQPVIVVVNGTATLSAGTLYGVLYGRIADWDRGIGSGQVRGSLIAEGNLSGSGTQTVVYDPTILNTLRTRNGSFVRVPGGWRDF